MSSNCPMGKRKIPVSPVHQILKFIVGHDYPRCKSQVLAHPVWDRVGIAAHVWDTRGQSNSIIEQIWALTSFERSTQDCGD